MALATPQRWTQPIDNKAINAIRFLAVDMVQKAESGHPGLPMGAAPMAYALWEHFLRFNPQDPHWPNRDRFVLSAGHGSALQYSLLYLSGFDLQMEDLKQFRQWNSRTPGHPEYGKTPGIEATTGPLGQGLGNAVGMAIAERALAAQFNAAGKPIIDHYTYVIASDGDLMEGVSSEVGSLAGHLGLGKLIVLYDNNHISIEGSTKLTFTEDRAARFAAFGWHTQRVEDGNDVAAICRAIEAARQQKDRPSFIEIHTHIGYGSPDKQDTAAAHGSPLGPEEVKMSKANLGWPEDKSFYIPDDVRAHFRQALGRGERWQQAWQQRYERWAEQHPVKARELRRRWSGILPDRWREHLPTFMPEDGPIATRKAAGRVQSAIAPELPELMGGSADLSPSTDTSMDEGGDFQADNPGGRNMHFGVREHGMGTILNGMAVYGGLRPFGASFLIFSDYMRPPMRLAAMNGLPVIYIFTHDSIALGEDGPTHQPVEQLLGLRSVPGLTVIRPADANESAQAWAMAIEDAKGPVVLALTRQKLPVFGSELHERIRQGVPRGAYILVDAAGGEAEAPPDIILLATGSEVHLAVQTIKKLKTRGVRARVVSAPCISIFTEQPKEYRDEVLPAHIPVLTLETGRSLGWQSYLPEHPAMRAVAVDHFGASAPGKIVMHHYGFNPDHILDLVETCVRETHPKEG